MQVYTGRDVEYRREQVDIVLTPEEAGLLLTVLGKVTDMTESEPMQRLYDRLLDAGLAETGDLRVEPNTEYDADFEDDEPYFVRLFAN